jgi:hypothetical protein
MFFRPATADNRLLDLAGRILVKNRASGKGCANGRGTGMTQFQRTVGIFMHKHLLYCEVVWRIFRDQVTYTQKYFPQAF